LADFSLSFSLFFRSRRSARADNTIEWYYNRNQKFREVYALWEIQTQEIPIAPPPVVNPAFAASAEIYVSVAEEPPVEALYANRLVVFIIALISGVVALAVVIILLAVRKKRKG
jgi:hypothetical protein